MIALVWLLRLVLLATVEAHHDAQHGPRTWRPRDLRALLRWG